MPDYVVTGPDGRQLRFTGPEAPSQAMIDQGFQKLPDPQQAWQKAHGIGPAKVGERYLSTGGPMGILDVIRTALGGAERPPSVAAQDPYGIQAWEKGAGPMPTPIMAETQARFIPLKHDAWKTLVSEPEYLYHATNLENLEGIAADKRLVPHGPSYGTDQSVWPDGSSQKRSYFTEKPSTAWRFAPEEGRPVLLKVRRDAAPFRRESTGDWYLPKPIDAQHLSKAHETGEWHPVISPVAQGQQP